MKRAVFICISQNVKYQLRNDLCEATLNYESCFIEIDQEEGKNIIFGVLYRAFTSIDNFITDISPTFETKTKHAILWKILILIY